MDCFRQSVAVEGYKGLMRGFSAAMYRAIPVNASIFLAVEGTRNLIGKVRMYVCMHTVTVSSLWFSQLLVSRCLCLSLQLNFRLQCPQQSGLLCCVLCGWAAWSWAGEPGWPSG